MVLEYIIAGFVFLIGICIGSFMNVCIYRIPLGMPVGGKERSVCLKCKRPIAFYDNIPLFSFLILRGRCRNCKERFSARYFFVELLTGFFALECFLTWGFNQVWNINIMIIAVSFILFLTMLIVITFINVTPIIVVPFAAIFLTLILASSGMIITAIYFLFIAVLIVITFIDIDHGIIPDIISLPGIPLFFLLTWIFIPWMTIWQSLLGILAGGGLLLAVSIAYRLVTHRDGMGGGDVKLLAMIGAVIGWKGVLFTIFISAIIGSVAGIILMLKNRKSLSLSMPYGPFLSMGAILYIFFGEWFFNWYISLLTF